MLITLEGVSTNLFIQYGEELSLSVDLVSRPEDNVYLEALVQDRSIRSEGCFYFMHLLQRDNSV